MLVVNGINTDLSINELFQESNISAGYIKGWSILSLLENPKDDENFNSLELNGIQFEIGFVGPSGNFYQIYAINDPTFQYGNKELEEDELNRIVALLQSVQPGSANTEAEPTNTEEEPAGTEEEPAGTEIDSPEPEPKIPLEELVSASEPEEAKEEITPEVEVPQEEPEIPQESEEYTKTRFALERNGYKEYSDGNYKLFAKADAQPYLLALEDSKVEDLPITEMEITDEYGDYFTTYEGKDIVFRFIIASETLTVMEPQAQ